MATTKYIIKNRGAGKTTQLLYASATTQTPIVTFSGKQCEYLKNRAKDLKICIPEPIDAYYLLDWRGNEYTGRVKEIYIDDAEEIISLALEHLLGVKVLAVTMTFPESAGTEVYSNTSHWKILTECSNSGLYCSRCNKKVVNNPKDLRAKKYCPNCGAEMDLEQTEAL